MLLIILAAAAASVYQLLALAAALLHIASRERRPKVFPPISILKPVRGRDPHFYEAIRSHASQNYPEYEILFGVADAEDPAVPEIRRLIGEFPERRIRLVLSSTQAANRKVGVLIDLAREARHPLMLVSDSDIRVPGNYLRRIVGPLEDPEVGLVTCLYGADSDHWPGRWEALGIATDFAPSVLVAPLVGVREFALGATLLFRAQDLSALGGFASLADYIADDYQLGRRITALGKRVVLAKVAVQTSLSGRCWSEVWRHQLRWARTIRVSRGGGYIGLPLANASLWALAAAIAATWCLALPLLLLRVITGVVVGAGILGRQEILRRFYLIPMRDLWGFAVWLWGLGGSSVYWRDARLRLTRDGRIAGPCVFLRRNRNA